MPSVATRSARRGQDLGFRRLARGDLLPSLARLALRIATRQDLERIRAVAAEVKRPRRVLEAYQDGNTKSVTRRLSIS